MQELIDKARERQIIPLSIYFTINSSISIINCREPIGLKYLYPYEFNFNFDEVAWEYRYEDRGIFSEKTKLTIERDDVAEKITSEYRIMVYRTALTPILIRLIEESKFSQSIITHCAKVIPSDIGRTGNLTKGAR